MAVYDDDKKSQKDYYKRLANGGANSKKKESSKTSDSQELADLSNKGFYTGKGAEKKKTSGAAESEKSGLFSRAGNKKKSKGKNKRRARALFAVSGVGGLGILFIGLMLYSFLGFSVEHLARLQSVYRYGQFHRQVGRVTRQVMVADMTLSADSRIPAGTLTSGRSSLLSRLPGWTPEKALRQLGASDLKLTYTKDGPLSRTVLTSFEDTRTGQVFSRDTLSEGQLLDELGSRVDSRFSEAGRGKIFRRRSMAHFRNTSNIRLARFKAFIAARDSNRSLSVDEGRLAGVNEDLDISQRGADFRPGNNKAAELADDKEAEARQKGTIDRSKRFLTPGQLRTLNNIGIASDWIFGMTLFCIARDIVGTIDDALNAHIGQNIRLSSSLFTASDMFRSGDATQEALRYEAQKWEGAEKSQEYAMAAGRAVSDQEGEVSAVSRADLLEASDYPFRVFGLSVATWNDIVGVAGGVLDAIDFVAGGFAGLSPVDKFCSIVLNPVAQGIVGGIEGVTLLATLGGTKIGTRAFREIAFQIIKGLGVSLAIGYVVDEVYTRTSNIASGVNAVVQPGEGAQGYNKVGAGNVASMIGQAQMYSGPIDAATVSNAQRESVLAFQQQEREKGFLYAYFSPRNPFSLTSSFATKAPMSFASIGRSASDFASWLFKPANNLNFAFAGVGAQAEYDPELEFYGMQDYLYGLTNGEATGSNPNYKFENLIPSIEANLDTYINDYGKCLVRTVVDIAREDGEFSNCDDEEASRFKMYYLFCETLDAVAREGTDNDGYKERDCTDLAGEHQNDFDLSYQQSSGDDSTIHNRGIA